MTEFESPGEWWLPGQPDRRVAGILKATNRGLRVTLFQPLADESLFDVDVQRYPTIYGSIHESPLGGGTEVTLFDAVALSRSLRSNGSSSETIAANRCYVGGVHLETKEQRFDRYEATLTGVSEWIPQTAIGREIDESGAVRVLMKTASFSIDMADWKMSFVVQGRAQASADRLVFHNERLVDVRFQEAISDDVATKRVFIPLRNFTSLITGVPSRIESSSVIVSDDGPWRQVVHDLSLRYRDPGLQPTEVDPSHDPLFRVPKETRALAALLERWWTLSRTHRRALDLAFGLLEQPPRYVEMRLILGSTVIDVFAERFAQGDPIALLDRLDARVVQQVGGAESFIRRWSDLRAKMWDEPPPPAQEVIAVTNALMWIIRLVLMSEIGVDPVDLLQSRRFEHMASRLREA